MTSGTSEDREMQDIQQDVLSEDDRSEQPAVGTSNAMSEGNMQIGMEFPGENMRETSIRLQ